MRNIATMAQRELGAYFLSPIAYAVNAMFLFTAGLAFSLGTFRPGGEASLRMLFDFWILLILVFVLPMLTMRLISEELRSGTIETLLTAPITETEVVLGKFFGAFLFYVILLVTLLLYPIILSIYGDVDLLLLICNYIGLLLVGALFVSVGLFFSTLTKHQIIAVLFSLALLALMTFAFHALSLQVEGWPRTVMQQLSIRAHFHDFVRGMLDFNHVVFFLSTTAFFLFAAVKLLEVRRWR
ncbi:MAG: ABC transporter permease subunit [Phycisphaerales bacterium]|nr:MAG: ABC transporter permease subunit [Phycisphaerales bacterium]